MTTEEAIKVLKELQTLMKDGRSMFNLTLKDKQALDKSIEVMKNSIKVYELPPMDFDFTEEEKNKWSEQ